MVVKNDGEELVIDSNSLNNGSSTRREGADGADEDGEYADGDDR